MMLRTRLNRLARTRSTALMGTLAPFLSLTLSHVNAQEMNNAAPSAPIVESAPVFAPVEGQLGPYQGQVIPMEGQVYPSAPVPMEGIPAHRYNIRHTHDRAGYPLQISPNARTAITPEYSGYYVGGGDPRTPPFVSDQLTNRHSDRKAVIAGSPDPSIIRQPGTFGIDYQGKGKWPRWIYLFSSEGRKKKAGYGAYKTDGPHVPDIFATKLFKKEEAGGEAAHNHNHNHAAHAGAEGMHGGGEMMNHGHGSAGTHGQAGQVHGEMTIPSYPNSENSGYIGDITPNFVNTPGTNSGYYQVPATGAGGLVPYTGAENTTTAPVLHPSISGSAPNAPSEQPQTLTPIPSQPATPTTVPSAPMAPVGPNSASVYVQMPTVIPASASGMANPNVAKPNPPARRALFRAPSIFQRR